MLGKVLVCGAAIPPSIKFFSIVNQLSRHKELAPLYDWALLQTSFEDKKKQDYKFGLFDVGKGADGLKFDLCVCKPCTAQEDAKLPVVNGTSVVQELETEREDCQCPCKNRRERGDY